MEIANRHFWKIWFVTQERGLSVSSLWELCHFSITLTEFLRQGTSEWEDVYLAHSSRCSRVWSQHSLSSSEDLMAGSTTVGGVHVIGKGQ